MIDKLSDKRLIFLGSFLGYLVTALLMVLLMKLQVGAFKLAAVLFIPFAISSFLVFGLYSQKIIDARTSQKAIWQSIIAATLTSLLTGFLAGIAGAIDQANKSSGPSSDPVTIIAVIAMFMVAGLIYSIPGIIVAGVGLGKMISKRQNSTRI